MRRRRDRGFTIIELLVAMALALVGLLGLVTLQLLAVRANNGSRNFLEATGLAQEKLETLQLTPYANLSLLTPCPSPLSSLVPQETQLTPQGATAAIAGSYSRGTCVTAGAGTMTIKIVVSWSDAQTNYAGQAITHSITVETLRSP
jgi:prepilin-type N-terminal cleavage/methylation domain-containing protein